MRAIPLVGMLCLAGAVAAAPNDGKPAASPRSPYVVTAKGVKAIDWRPLPAPDAAAPQTLRPAVAAPALAAPLEDTFKLHSCTSATKVIYLDFDGHVGMDGAYAPFNFEGATNTFSDAERTRIQQVWQSVTEDFMPFEVDVTTEDPGVEALKKSGAGDTRWGVRVVIASAPWDYSWGYVNSFNSRNDQEVYAYTGDFTWIWIADSISHEVGHSLGLDEHGGGGDGTYYEGHGSGLTHWAPIMGWTKMSEPYGLSQWDKGEYPSPDHSEDSLNIITTKNGFGYRPDDHGSTASNATPIGINYTGLTFVAEGIIERNTDIDYFAFTLPGGGGTVRFRIDPNLATSANLDILATLYDAGGVVLTNSNPRTNLVAAFDVPLGAGSYYLSVEGTGLNDPNGPPADGYSKYGCLGYYSIRAMAASSAAPPTARFTATPTNGYAPLTVTFTDTSTGGSGAITGRSWSFGDGLSTNTSGTNLTHRYTGAGNYSARLTVTNSAGLAGSATGMIAIAAVPRPTCNSLDAIGAGLSGHCALTIAAANGVKYRIVCKTNLLDTNAWAPLTNGWTGGTNSGPVTIIHQNATNSPRFFYRIEAESKDAAP